MQGLLPVGFILCFFIQSFRNSEPYYQVWGLTAPLLCHCRTVTEVGAGPW